MTSRTPRATRSARVSAVVANASRISPTAPVPPGGLRALPPSATTARSGCPPAAADIRVGAASRAASEAGGADEPRLAAQRRLPDPRRWPVTPTGQRRRERLAGRRQQQVARVGDAAADDEPARVEDRGDVGEPLAEPAADLLEAV